MFIIALIIGLIIGSLGIYFYLKPKLKTFQVWDQETDKANQEINQLNNELTQENNELSQKNNKLFSEYKELSFKIQQTNDSLEQLSKQTQLAANLLYEQSYAVANEKMSNSAEKLSKEYQAEEEKLKKEYLELAENQTKEYQTKIKNMQQEALTAENQLTELQSKLQSTLEAVKRQEELELNIDKYRILLSNDEKNEILAFNSIAHLILNKRNLYMFLWTNYYSKRVNELAIRVLGDKPIIGIYKITNIETQQVYIGQSKQIRERWREHCKAGLQIDTPGNNKLYLNMIKYGLENFTFELMEQCSIDQLNERENYWIEFYKSCDYGLNGNKGIRR